MMVLDDHFSSEDWKLPEPRLEHNVAVYQSNQPYQHVQSEVTKVLCVDLSVSVVTRSFCENKNSGVDVLLNFHYRSHYLSHQS